MDIQQIMHHPAALAGVGAAAVIGVVLIVKRGGSSAAAVPSPAAVTPASAGALGDPSLAAGTGVVGGTNLAQEVSDVTSLAGALQQLQTQLGQGSGSANQSPTGQGTGLASSGNTFADLFNFGVGSERIGPQTGRTGNVLDTSAQAGLDYWQTLAQFQSSNPAYEAWVQGGLQQATENAVNPGAWNPAAAGSYLNQGAQFLTDQTLGTQVVTPRGKIAGQIPTTGAGTGSGAGGGGLLGLAHRHLGTVVSAAPSAPSRQILAPFRPSADSLRRRGWERYTALWGMS